MSEALPGSQSSIESPEQQIHVGSSLREYHDRSKAQYELSHWTHEYG